MLTKTLKANINQSQCQTSLAFFGIASKPVATIQSKSAFNKSSGIMKTRAVVPAMKMRSSQSKATFAMAGSATAEPPTKMAEPGAPGTMPTPGILDNLFPPTAQGEDSLWDKVTDPFGKQKEEKRKEQKKKIDELYGKGTASSVVMDEAK